MFTNATMIKNMRKAITIAAVCGRGRWFKVDFDASTGAVGDKGENS